MQVTQKIKAAENANVAEKIVQAKKGIKRH